MHNVHGNENMFSVQCQRERKVNAVLCVNTYMYARDKIVHTENKNTFSVQCGMREQTSHCYYW